MLSSVEPVATPDMVDVEPSEDEEGGGQYGEKPQINGTTNMFILLLDSDDFVLFVNIP